MCLHGMEDAMGMVAKVPWVEGGAGVKRFEKVCRFSTGQRLLFGGATVSSLKNSFVVDRPQYVLTPNAIVEMQLNYSTALTAGSNASSFASSYPHRTACTICVLGLLPVRGEITSRFWKQFDLWPKQCQREDTTYFVPLGVRSKSHHLN